METLRSLATLAFDCRRPDEFRAQLLDALRVIQRGDLSPQEMRGPWAGEVGQFQFVPSVYYKYAVDLDGSGKPRPDHEHAGCARFGGELPRRAWLEGRASHGSRRCACRRDGLEPGGASPSRSRAPTGRRAASPIRAARRCPADNVPTALLLPMGRNGPAFLAYPNFDVYLQWNQSLVYSTTAGYYATRLAGAPALSRGNGPIETLSQAQAKELQQTSRQARLRRGQDRRGDRRLDPRGGQGDAG